MIIGKGITIAGSAENIVSILGAPLEKITVQDTVSNEILSFIIDGALVNYLTLNDYGIITTNQIPRGNYHFTGSVSSGSGVRRRYIQVSSNSIITMWPDNARILYWYGHYGAINPDNELKVDATRYTRFSSFNLSSSNKKSQDNTNNMYIYDKRSTNSDSGNYTFAGKQGIKQNIIDLMQNDFYKYLCIRAKGTYSSNANVYGGLYSSNDSDNTYISRIKFSDTASNYYILLLDENDENIYKNQTSLYVAGRGQATAEYKVNRSYSNTLYAMWLDTDQIPSATQLGNTHPIQISNVDDGVLRYSNIAHQKDGETYGAGWYAPNGSSGWPQLSTTSLFGHKYDEEFSGATHWESTLIPINLGTDILTNKVLETISITFNGLCPNQDFASKGFRWAICSSAANKNKYANTASAVTDDESQIKRGTAYIKYNSGKSKTYTIDLSIGETIGELVNNSLYLYFYPKDSTDYGIAHIANNIYVDLYVID